MDEQELVEVLRALDGELTSASDVVLVGGAAMILHFGARRATRDVDVLPLQGDIGELRRAVKTIARQHALPEDWMSDAVKGFVDILLPGFSSRLVRLDLSLEHLRLYVPGRPEQVAMEVVALRERDLEDLELLLPTLTEADKGIIAGIVEHVGTFRPDWAQKMRYFLLEQGWQIQ